MLSRAIQQDKKCSSRPRVVITGMAMTFPVDASRDTIRRHCETSLRMLGVDRIDLYQLHVPDPAISMREAMATFAELKDERIVRDVGVCNVSMEQLHEAIAVVPVVSVQNRYSPFHQEDMSMVEHCAKRAIAYLAHSPLGGGPPPRGSRAAGLAASFPAAAALAQRMRGERIRTPSRYLLKSNKGRDNARGSLSHPEVAINQSGGLQKRLQRCRWLAA